MTQPPVAYCGIPAIPSKVWTSWNFDPVVVLALSALAVLVWYRNTVAARRAGIAGVALMAVIFISPLCALSAALFSARVAHHMLLIAGVAPLLAIAFPSRRRARSLSLLFGANLVFLWVWHVPDVYNWAVWSLSGYWLMQASLLGAAFVMWREVLRPGGRTGGNIAVLLGTVAQMGLLGALITFAPRPLYTAHFMTTEIWGLSPLEDQQLAGLIMWVPAILPYLAVALVIGMPRLFPAEQAR